MEQHDYLKKQIDTLGMVLRELISQIIGLGNKGENSQGIEITNMTLQNELDIDIESLILIPVDKFLDTLLSKKQLDNVNLELLADTLFEYADNLLESDNSTKKLLFEKVLLIYNYIDNEDTVFSFDRHLKVERINNSL